MSRPKKEPDSTDTPQNRRRFILMQLTSTDEPLEDLMKKLEELDHWIENGPRVKSVAQLQPVK